MDKLAMTTAGCWSGPLAPDVVEKASASGVEGPPAIDIGLGGSPVSVAYHCHGCGTKRTFTAGTMAMIGQQIASAGWKVDGVRAECPSCWMAYQQSVLRAARGNS